MPEDCWMNDFWYTREERTPVCVSPCLALCCVEMPVSPKFLITEVPYLFF